MKDFSRKLIGWYEKHRRDLPWRQTTNPYHIWLSEVILQQTRVDQGLSYYLKFLKLFPTVHDLAGASEDQVLKAWQGLGYYSRARNLHHTAQLVVEHGQGLFPLNYEGLIKLKGIGPYTAAAIASFAYNEKKPVIDGNVVRVLSRIFGIEHAIDSKEGKNAIAQLAEELIDPRNPASYNQAIMEFGALHCTPRLPQCDTCPFYSSCFAFAKNRVSDFPVKKKKTRVKNLWITYFHIDEPRYVWIRKRGLDGIWKGLYDFPGIESESEPDLGLQLTEFLKSHALQKRDCVISSSEPYLHILTHRRIHARFIHIKTKSKMTNPPADWLRIAKTDLSQYGVPRLVEKYLADDSR
jgi:A/G-specific adenine glycosylase